MSHPVGSLLRNRIEVGFVEADVEIGFNLVDLAETESGRGNASLASRVLQDAEDVFHDIEQRLQRVAPGDRGSFGPLVGELRREIDLAKLRNSSR